MCTAAHQISSEILEMTVICYLLFPRLADSSPTKVEALDEREENVVAEAASAAGAVPSPPSPSRSVKVEDSTAREMESWAERYLEEDARLGEGQAEAKLRLEEAWSRVEEAQR